MEHPAKRRLGVLRFWCRHLLDQYRIQRRPQRHCLLDHGRSFGLIHTLHRMHDQQTPSEGTAASRTFLSWAMGNDNQRHRDVFPRRLLPLHLLPHCYSGRCANDELEHCHVRRRHLVRNGLVLRYWAQDIPPTSEHSRQEQVEDSGISIGGLISIVHSLAWL